MAVVRDVPDMTRQKVAVGSRHRSFLEGPFHGQKATSKPLKDGFYAAFHYKTNNLAWSDPEPVSSGFPPGWCRLSPPA
jgi:hypothetical protein